MATVNAPIQGQTGPTISNTSPSSVAEELRIYSHSSLFYWWPDAPVSRSA
jgi:hypothetical protein